MSKPKSYDPSRVKLTFNGIPITGFASDPVVLHLDRMNLAGIPEIDAEKTQTASVEGEITIGLLPSKPPEPSRAWEWRTDEEDALDTISEAVQAEADDERKSLMAWTRDWRAQTFAIVAAVESAHELNALAEAGEE